MKPVILVSMCLLGICCRYDGHGQARQPVLDLMDRCTLIPVCPEQLGGLSTPRAPAERIGELVMNNAGADVTNAFRSGAERALELARLYQVSAALLKSRSPSCGNGAIYDGTFSGALREGDGMTAELLKSNGIRVFTDEQIPDLLECLGGMEQ